MQLTVKRAAGYDYLFMQWLLRRVQMLLYQHINTKRLKVFTDYAKKSKLFDTKNNSDINMQLAVIRGIQSLRCQVYKNAFVIEVDKSITYPQQFVKVAALCRFVNYGVSDLKGYPIFDEVFAFVSDNLSEYYREYIYNMFGVGF